jgi:hypothetical protein
VNGPNHRFAVTLAGALLVVSSQAYLAQEPSLKRTPPPELDALAWMIGVWETTAKCRFTPDAPVFEGKSVESIYWSESHQFLISDMRGLTPGGWANQLQVTTWDPLGKQFQMTDLTPGGDSYRMTMTIEGGIAKIVGSRTNDGHTTRIWVTVEHVSRTESRFRSECSVDDGPKWVFSEGVSKKVR